MAEKAQTLPPDTQLFRDVFNASPIGIAVENLEGQPLFVNPSFCSFLGFSEEELRIKHCVDFSPREDAEKDWALFQQLRAGLIDHYELEKRYFRRDGSTVWGRLSISLLKGSPAPLVVAMVEDITEKRMAEEALRNSEERFRLAAKAGKMFAYEWDVATDVVVRSGDVADVLGATDGAPLTRQQILARVHPDDRVLFADSALERTPENPNVQITYRMLCTDGSVVWLEKTARAFFDEDGRMVRIIGMISAITERKRAEETLRESEEKFRSIFRDAAVGMVIVSPEGRFLAANGTFCDDLGYTEKELVEKTVRSLTFAEDWPSFSQKLNQAVTEGGFHKFEKRCLHKTGRIIWTESTASLIRSRDGNPQYFVVGVLDVTKRKEAEEALSTVNRRLIEAQEQERTRIGRELHDDVNQRLAMLAVELEQLQNYPSELENRVRKLLNETNEISNDVEALSHELHSSKLEHLGVVAGIRSWSKEFGERQNIEIDFRSDVATVPPFEIGICLFRVLQEALHNIVKHSGVKRVDVRLTEHSNQIHLRVSDSGKGFDVQSTMQGKGLGLTSMRERVRLVNGTIAIESKPMGGTIIECHVPLESQQASQRAS
jgi:PAS domain S-box-containing protein